METGACDERAENNINENVTSEVHRHFKFLPFLLRKLSSAFGLTASKGCYPHYFNTPEKLDCVCSIPDTNYGIDKMTAGERAEFLALYDTQRSVLSDNRRVLETFCQNDVTVLRQACL